MVLTVPINTYNALANAPVNGIVPRDFVWIRALNTDTGVVEEIGIWNGNVPVSVPVIRPSDGAEIVRIYQGIAGLMQVPSLPMQMKLEVRSVKLEFSNLTPALINAVKVYDPKGRAVQIHRGLLDPSTMNLVDPAICRFDGFTNRAPIRRGKDGGEGKIILECQSHARLLAAGSPDKLSDEFFRRRGGRQPYLDVVPNVTWGQEDKVKERGRRRRTKWID